MSDFHPFTQGASFAELAEAYGELLERAASMDVREFLVAVHVQLAKLLAAGLELPPIGPEEDEPESEAANAAEEERREFAEDEQDRKALEARLGRFDFYSEVFDWYDADDPVGGSLADDLVDIRADLEKGLKSWRAGAHKKAGWAWRF